MKGIWEKIHLPEDGPGDWEILMFIITQSGILGAVSLCYELYSDKSNNLLSVKSQNRKGLYYTIRELKQRRFWATHINWKWGLLPFVCLDSNKFVLLSFFSLIKRIYSRVSTKPLPNGAKSLLPVEVRRLKMLLLKLPIVFQTTLKCTSKFSWCTANHS